MELAETTMKWALSARSLGRNEFSSKLVLADNHASHHTESIRSLAIHGPRDTTYMHSHTTIGTMITANLFSH
jgi:hypothetical protein